MKVSPNLDQQDCFNKDTSDASCPFGKGLCLFSLAQLGSELSQIVLDPYKPSPSPLPPKIPYRSYSLILICTTIVGFMLAFIYFRQAAISDRKVKAHDTQWDQTLTAVKVGKWSLDVGSGKLSWDESMFGIFGVDPSKFVPSYDSFVDLISEEDAVWVNDIVQKTLSSGNYYRAVFRLKTGQYVRIYGKIVNSNGSKIFAGICTPSSSDEYTGRPVVSISPLKSLTPQS